MKESLRKWLSQWNDLTERSVTTLKNLLDSINTRRVPKQNLINEVKQSLNEIQIQADELLPFQSLLDDITPITSPNTSIDEQVQTVLEWIEASQIKLLQAAPILNKFAHVIGRKEPYDQEIASFRNRAIEMIAALDQEISPTILKQHLTWVENFRLFLEALQLSEEEMNQKSELIDEIIPTIFSRFITKGIILGMYYVNLEVNPNIEIPKPSIDATPTKPIIVEPIEKPAEPMIPSVEGGKPIDADPTEPPADPIIDDPILASEEPIPPSSTLEEPISVDTVEAQAEPIQELPRPKIIHNTRGGIGPKAFKSDLGETALPYRIFHAIALLTVCTFDQLWRFIQVFSKDTAKESVQKQIDKMIRKGHLMEYELSALEIHYLGVSSSSRMLLFKDSMQSRWSEVGVLPIPKPTHLPDIEITDVETLEHINHASEGLIRLVEWILPKQNAKLIKNAPDQFSKETTYFLATAPKKDEEPESTAIVYAEEWIDHPAVQKLVQDHPEKDVLLTIPFFNQEDQPRKEWNRSWMWPNRVFVYDHEPIQIGLEPSVQFVTDETKDSIKTNEVIKPDVSRDTVLPMQTDPAQEPALKSETNMEINSSNQALDRGTLIEKGTSIDALREAGRFISDAIVQRQFSEAVVLSKALTFIPSEKSNEFATLQQWLAHATGIHLEPAHYSSHFLGDLESKSISLSGLNTDFVQALLEASYLRAVIAPEARYDYGLASYAKHMAEESKTGLGSVFFKMEEVLGKLHQGYTRSILKVLKASQEKVSVQESIKKKALEYLSKPNNDIFVGMERFNIECFGNNSELYKMLSVVSRDDEKGIPEIEQLFHHKFGLIKKEGGEISLQIHPDMINAYIDQTWHHVRKHEMELRYRARDTVFNNIERRLEVIQDWMESKSQKIDGIQENIPFLIQKRQELLTIIQKTKKEITSQPLSDTTSLLVYALQKTFDYLDHYGNIDIKQDFVTFFKTPYLVMDEFKVKLMPKLQEIVGQEPWRMVLKHMQEKKIGLEEALLAIDNPKNEIWYNNYGQYEQIHILLYPEDADLKLGPTKFSAKQWAEKQFANFRSGVEMARAYYRIDENLENKYLQYAETIKSDFFDFDEYGKYRQVLKSIESMIHRETQTRKLEFLNRIDTYEKDDKINLIYKDTLISARKWTESENFSVAEEYLSGVGNGGQFSRIDDVLSLTEKKYNEKYLSNYQSHLLSICKGSSGKMLRNWGYKAIEAQFPKDWTSRQKDSSKELLEAWSSSRTSANTPNNSEKAVQSLLSKLGLSVSNVRFQPAMSKKNDIFEATMIPSKKQKMDYSHPISTFGTHIDDKMPIVYVFGNHGATEILSDLNEMQLRSSAIVIIDAPLSLQVRREIAERVKTQQASLVRPFLIIDQTLILYLATLEESERMLALLQCTMPYLNVQPFVNGAGAIPDEMFIGRKQELNQILSNDGPSILYGGRQLGKSALLHRAKSIKHDPERQSYAIYIDARNQKTKGLLKKIIDQFRSEKLISRFTKEELDYESVFADIKQGFVRGSISELALYIDEADSFFEDFSKACGRVLSIFLNLKRETHGKFRFLFAGLHNVMRFGNNMRDNSVLPQLGTPLCITPLSTADAFKLIEMPLTYLGYHLNSDQMALILANSLYFPGILHLIGYSIINATKGLYLNGIYSAANNPPYQINDASLQSIFYQEKINHEIEQKLEITLGLDQRYKKIAVIIAYLYHTEKAQIQDFRGFSLDRIKRFAEVEGLKLISDLSNTDLQGLLTEMKDMGILQADPGTQNYRFRKNSFRDIIAATEEIAFAKLLSVSEEGTNS